MKHIKYTTSVCPQCLKHLKAEVMEGSSGIFLVRTCPEHGEFSNIVEKDTNFYRAAANINKERFTKEADWLVLPITDRCNQNCKFCFYPKGRNKDLSLQQIIEIVKKSPPIICLSGGEPTLHPDLPEIITRLKSIGKTVQVLTNGLRLADLELVKTLKAAGLKSVLFSLNGFSDHILEQIDNAPCLEQKLKAIENLKAQGIQIELSISLLRGVNEGELKKALEFCLQNSVNIFGLRVRAFAQTGRSQNTLTLTMGEMVALLSEALGVKKEELTNSMKTRKISSALMYCAALCFLNSVKSSVFLTDLDLYFSGLMKRRSLRMVVVALKILYTRGPRIFVKALFDILSGRGKISWLVVKMFSWPDRYCLDLQEVNSTGGTHLNSKNEIGNFQKVLILDKTE